MANTRTTAIMISCAAPFPPLLLLLRLLPPPQRNERIAICEISTIVHNITLAKVMYITSRL
jgi:hypothetical protein